MSLNTIFSSSIEVQFTQCKIHPFKVYNSVGFFHILPELCNYHHYLVLEYFIPRNQKNPMPVGNPSLSIPPLPPASSTSNLLTVAMDLPIADISQKWNHATRAFVSSFFRSARCFQDSCMLYTSLLHSFLCPSNIPLHGYLTFYLFIHQLIDIWIVFMFLLL